MKKDNKKDYKVKAAFNDTEVGSYQVGDNANLTKEQAKQYKMFLDMPKDKGSEVITEPDKNSEVIIKPDEKDSNVEKK